MDSSGILGTFVGTSGVLGIVEGPVEVGGTGLELVYLLVIGADVVIFFCLSDGGVGVSEQQPIN